MSSKAPIIKRRTVIGTVLAVLVAPQIGRAQTGGDPASQVPTDMKISLTFGDHIMTATLYDNPSARDFYSMLPLDLSIDDYANNEKIAYLPRKLSDEARGSFNNELPYDLCYFRPWGNLALFYAPYRYSNGLIRLGRFDAGYEALHVRGKFPLNIGVL